MKKTLTAFFLSCYFLGSQDKPEKLKKIDWESFLPALSFAESDHYLFAIDPSGAHNGRGIYQIGEQCLQHYKDKNPGNNWITPAMLFNPKISKPIALWYLNWLDSLYQNDDNKVYWVLTSYNAGPTGASRYGINYRYCARVLLIKEIMDERIYSK